MVKVSEVILLFSVNPGPLFDNMIVSHVDNCISVTPSIFLRPVSTNEEALIDLI